MTYVVKQELLGDGRHRVIAIAPDGAKYAGETVSRLSVAHITMPDGMGFFAVTNYYTGGPFQPGVVYELVPAVK